jgi:Outer membrane efflux protein
MSCARLHHSDVALGVVGACLEVLRRKETTAAAEDNIEAHRHIYEQIKLRSDRGVGRRADHMLGPTNDRRVMLRLRFNIFQGGADKARIGETAAQVREAEEVRNRTRREVQESVSLAFNAYLTSRDRLVVLQQWQRDVSVSMSVSRRFRRRRSRVHRTVAGAGVGCNAFGRFQNRLHGAMIERQKNSARYRGTTAVQPNIILKKNDGEHG